MRTVLGKEGDNTSHPYSMLLLEVGRLVVKKERNKKAFDEEIKGFFCLILWLYNKQRMIGSHR